MAIRGGGRILETYPGGGGGNPYDGPYGEAPPKRKTLFRLQVYKRVGIYWLKYIKGYENLSFRSVRRLKELTNAFYGCEKVKKKNVEVL